jgi:hypothetical protein
MAIISFFLQTEVQDLKHKLFRFKRNFKRFRIELKLKFKKLFLNKKHEELKRRLKHLFRAHFEGFGDPCEDPMSHTRTPISKYQITDLKFKFYKSKIIIIVTTERPGLLIGKGGRTIDGLTQWLSERTMPVEIQIKESKIW